MINSKNYIVIQGWMLTNLKLKGNELIIYAIIYGFSQIEGGCFNGSLAYLSEWTNSTKQNVRNQLKSLQQKGLIEKKEIIKNKVVFNEYSCTKLESLDNFEGESKNLRGDLKNFEGVVKNFEGGGQNFLPNNIEYNIDNKINNNKEDSVIRDDVQEVFNLYNQICTNLPKAKILSESRKKNIKKRLKELSIEEIKEIFKKCNESKFCTGENDRGWRVDFDWLFKNDSNYIKVLEGRYKNKKEKPKTEQEEYNEWFESLTPQEKCSVIFTAKKL